MDAAELFDEWLEETIHRESQVDEHGVHLTAGHVALADSRAEIDFGGSEFEPCTQRDVAPTKKQPDDDYGWWRLEKGAYLLEFNERLKEGAPPMLLVPNGRLLACGCSLAACVCAAGPLRSVLTVPERGVAIKENARIALLRPLS
jgi:hypothetical protein